MDKDKLDKFLKATKDKFNDLIRSINLNKEQSNENKERISSLEIRVMNLEKERESKE